MRQIHEGIFEVSDPEKYRELVGKQVIHEESLVRGNRILHLKEIESGRWSYTCEVDSDHPRVNELMTFLPNEFGVNYTLTSLPKITPVETCQKMKKELKAMKSSLERVS